MWRIPLNFNSQDPFGDKWQVDVEWRGEKKHIVRHSLSLPLIHENLLLFITLLWADDCWALRLNGQLNKITFRDIGNCRFLYFLFMTSPTHFPFHLYSTCTHNKFLGKIFPFDHPWKMQPTLMLKKSEWKIYFWLENKCFVNFAYIFSIISFKFI